MYLLDDNDKKLLNAIQSDFPVDARPYLRIAENTGMTEQEVLSRLTKLKENGIIRRIGGNFRPDKLGFFSTLCAARVPEEKIKIFSETVNSYPGVTHNYQRENEFNIWFTFIEPSMEIIESNIKEISEKTGVTEILNLPATNVFKIKAKFKL